MKRVGPILLLIAAFAVTAVMYFVPGGNSHRYAYGWKLTAFEIFMILPLILIITTVVLSLRPPKRPKKTAAISFIERRLGARTVGPPAMYVMAIIMVICLLCWLAVFFVIYVADDLTSPAWDERSVPAPRTY